MNESTDAIVLAGNRGASRNFADRNKNFLDVAGKPILEHVLDTLECVERVNRIVVVGPVAEIHELIGDKINSGHWRTPIEVIEQKNTLIENAWAAFCRVIGEDVVLGEQPSSAEKAETPAFFLAGDLPLVTPAEVNEFLDGCFAADADCCCGMTEEASMARFYPAGEKPGIEMAYLHLASGSYRLNNMHFARPFKVGNLPYIQRIYQARYQKKVRNILKIISDILSADGLGLRPLMLYLQLQLCVLFQALKFGPALRWTRKRLTRERVAEIARVLLQARTVIVETKIGGAAIDVDNEQDYETIRMRFAEWVGEKGGKAEHGGKAEQSGKAEQGGEEDAARQDGQRVTGKDKDPV